MPSRPFPPDQARHPALADELAARPFPSAEEEIWRYSRIAELDLDAFLPIVAGQPSAPNRYRFGAEGRDPDSGQVATVEMVDGWPTRIDVAPGARVTVRVDDSAPESSPDDYFALANAAFAPAPLIVEVAPGATLAGPVVVRHLASATGGASFPRLVVRAGADSESVVVEEFAGDPGPAFVAPVTTVHAEQAARVGYLSVNRLGHAVWLIAEQTAVGERDSHTVLASVALGGDYARVRTDARLVGQGATGRQIAAYFGEAQQMHDFRTLQDHLAPKTTSDLLFKGAMQGHAKSVYTGLIHIGKDAKGSSAFQTNRNIKLSEGAWAESVPNLDIENNDVHCSHASAVGPVDEEQRFYLESRGIPSGVAERLIVIGFFDEVLAQLPAQAWRPGLRAEIIAKLDRRDA
jgi:Fe-S cluster assembly protein SufD